MDEKQIIKLIKDGKFSELKFLSDKVSQQENENYYGFLYFLLDKKREDTGDVLKNIELKYESRALAYEYLGRIASKVYPQIGEEHVSLSFFRKSIELDKFNSSTWWGIYNKSRDSKAFLEYLKIDFDKGKFLIIKNNLINFDFYFSDINNYSKEDCKLIIKIIFDSNIRCEDECKKILIAAYYILERYDDGVNLIKNTDYVGIKSIQNYYNKNLIELDTAISKTYSFNPDELLKDDHERVYVECLKEAEKKKANPTKAVLIMKAFRASKFSDVIKYYNEIPDDIFFKHDLESHLYYLISQLYLNDVVDERILNYVRKNEGNILDQNIGLLKAFYFKYYLHELENKFTKIEDVHHQIYNTSSYQQIEKLLEDKNLLSYYLYDDLCKDLESLVDKWNKSNFKFRLDAILENKDSELSDDDFIELCSLWIENDNYDYVIDNITNFHNENPATITTFNLLGVCLERKGLFTEAFEEYKKSLNLMLEHKEYNYYIFSNYLTCAKKASVNISDEQYNELKNNLNISLVETFKWHTFTSENWRRLFKYSPFNLNTFDSLFNQYFYLPSKEQLNDPIELPKLKKIGPKHLIDSNYRICSFSNNEKAMLMWSHYTEEHQGIMVEYYFGGELPSGVGIEKVKYTNESKRNRESDKYIFNQFLLTKNEEWSYEEEVRLLSYQKDKVYYENYDYPNHDREKVNAKILSITLGCNFDESKKPLVVNFIRNVNDKRKDYDQKIKLRQAKILENNLFGLEYIDINI
jgi:hypothetical protein